MTEDRKIEWRWTPLLLSWGIAGTALAILLGTGAIP